MMVVLAPDIPDDQMPGMLERVAGYVTTGGGEITSLNTTSHNTLTLGRRRLTYPINKYRDGFYALYHFNLDPLGIVELERELRLNTQVLRHLVLTYAPPKPKKPKKVKGDAAATEATDDAAPVAAALETPTNGRVPVTSASGAEVDTDAPVPPAPDGTELNEPPTAETPAVDEDDE